MILFLDTVSPLPEFSIIEDNKIIYSREILTNNQDKMSDCIIPIYIDIEKKFLLSKKLKYLITNTGPGSYTSLRIGIAFLSGLSIALKIRLIGISCVDLFKYIISEDDRNKSAIYINSSHEQNFICLYSKEKNSYKIDKCENYTTLYIDDLSIIKIFTNSILPLGKISLSKKIEFRKKNFNAIVNQNIKKIISLPIKKIIEPIYVSNNKILN